VIGDAVLGSGNSGPGRLWAGGFLTLGNPKMVVVWRGGGGESLSVGRGGRTVMGTNGDGESSQQGGGEQGRWCNCGDRFRGTR
jgi:hypothetical protein